ncbi:cell adhesion molecule Dscam1 isoform X12 [Atheta coriaria]|uniref:cell adhesion molecule Dscam1 isoform X12 n=1 Tax=Dalotia coriaria TaxID=877792 RepID=UPI0031F399B2
MKWLQQGVLPAVVLVAFASVVLCDDTTHGPVFEREPPNRVDFSNTTGAVVECRARGSPQPEIIWVRADGTAVGDVPGLRKVLANGNLVFPPFRAEDYRQDVHAQVYSCLAKNSVGTINSRDVNVRAVVQQFYQSRVIDEFVLRGNTGILKCLVPSFVTDFVIIEAWIAEDGTTFKYDPDISSKSKSDSKYLVLPSGELHIRDVGPEDGYKSYQCRTRHRLTNETRMSATKGRLVITEPTGKIAPKVPGQKYEGGKIVLNPTNSIVVMTCDVVGYPVPTFRWYKFVEGTSRKQAIALNERVKQVAGTLIIREAKVEDSGKYLCVVNNSVGGESVETVLTVTAPLKATIEPKVQTIDFGRPAVFTCNFEGNPIKTVNWLKDGHKLDHTEAILRIEAVRKEDKGMYQCFIRNDQESAEATAELKLGSRFEPPLIKQSFDEQTLRPGPSTSLYLSCSASGTPTPEITWELDGRRLSNTDRYQIGQYVTVNGDVVSNLNISAIHTIDGGIYKCVASSKVGSAEHQAKISVYGAPFVRSMEKQAIVAGGTLIVHCPVAGYPIDTIVWERDSRVLPTIKKQKVFPNGTLIIENVERSSDQATYVCVAKNSQGHSARGTLEVQVMVQPHIIPFDFEGEVNNGDSVQLNCYVNKGDSPIQISWLLNDKPIEYDDVSMVPFGGRTNILTIGSVQAHHMGNYTCKAENRAGFSTHLAILLVNVPPRWILEPTDKAFAQDSDAAVECKADGFPKPTVTWKKATGETPGDYKDLKPNNPDIKVEDGTLMINNIQKINEGYYLCEAVNGIGSGLSAVVLIGVQAPPQFEIKQRNHTSRRGEAAVMQCEAKGEKPIGILWNMNNKRLEPKGDSRYTIREEILPTGVLSALSIKRTERSDTAVFTCVATNAFGSDNTSIHMIVQEVPEIPYDLKVLDKSGRSVQLSWVAPYDGNSNIKRYMIEYKPSKSSWEHGMMERVLVPGEQTEAGVFTLKPATTYHIRIVAENEMGSSDPSDTVTIITAEEVPSGPPSSIRVEAPEQHMLKVFWKPPPRSEWNGEILGYYVGYKLASMDKDKPYFFETVEFSREEGKEHHLQINNLKTYTQYSIVVQAFNKVGKGPISEDLKVYTAEGAPEQPPVDTTCTTLTAQTIRVMWVSPSLTAANGVIKGYKVIYGPSETWFDENTKDAKITASSETILHGLKKYTNYSMQVLAYTSGGDGVRSPPIHCQTEQDVPEAPTSVKALVMSDDSILVSWKPPSEPNGIVEQYTVYLREAPDGEGTSSDAKPLSHKVIPNIKIQNLSFQAKDLNKQLKYEFWVTASTNIGEGQTSETVTVSPSSKVPAKIASFDDSFTSTYKEDVTLPCLAVGVPQPEIKWKIKGSDNNNNDRIRQQPDGSLFIRDVHRDDAGEYSCRVNNIFGNDSITHKLVVNAPPHSPHVSLTSTTTNSLTIKLKPDPSDIEPIHGYTVHYKPEFGEWETAQVANNIEKYVLEKLVCGTRYQVYVTAYNSIGNGDQSDNLNTRTRGEKPIGPSADKFIVVSSNSITLHLNEWSDGGCPMLYFVVEQRKKTSPDWVQVSNNVKVTGNFVVLDLDPATWYHLRVTAHNNAGFTVAKYEFATLTAAGGSIAPVREVFGTRLLLPWLPEWVDLNIAVPVAATAIVVAVGIIVICVAVSRRALGPTQTRLTSDYDVVYNQSVNAVGTLDKRRPDLRDELGYIAPPNRKLPPVPGSNYNTCDRIKRGPHYRAHATWDPRRHLYEELCSRRGSNDTIHNHRGMDDEICPYATFHLLGFREEMDPTKAMQFQTFPHPHAGTMGPSGMGTPHQAHSRAGSQSMPRQNRRYDRVGSQGSQYYTQCNGSIYSPGPEYDDPANCAPEDEQYGSQYCGYGNPYDQYGSRGSIGRRSLGSLRIQPTASSPEPPPPPPRNHDPNDSKDSNEISEAECDRDQLINSRTYGVMRNSAKDGMNHEEMRKLIERNEIPGQANGGLTAYDTMAV